MNDTTTTKSPGPRIALLLAVLLVLVGMVNTLPEIPGLQNWARDLTGIRFFRISGFPTEYLFPPLFVLMMVIVALDASLCRTWRETRPKRAWLGAALDIGLVVAALLWALGFGSKSIPFA